MFYLYLLKLLKDYTDKLHILLWFISFSRAIQLGYCGVIHILCHEQCHSLHNKHFVDTVNNVIVYAFKRETKLQNCKITMQRIHLVSQRMVPTEYEHENTSRHEFARPFCKIAGYKCEQYQWSPNRKTVVPYSIQKLVECTLGLGFGLGIELKLGLNEHMMHAFLNKYRIQSKLNSWTRDDSTGKARHCAQCDSGQFSDRRRSP